MQQGEGDAGERPPAVLFATSLYYVRSRQTYLREVLATIAQYPIDVAFHAFTNATKDGARADIASIMREAGFKPDENAFIHSIHVKGNPYGLTWSHKALIASQFLGSPRWTHFVYIEDDERFTYENFQYFQAAREKLRSRGLLPGYLRTEWSARLNAIVNTDNERPMRLDGRAAVNIDGYRFVNADNPYHGAYVLDQELAREYVASASFDREKSAAVTSCGVPERAAMGLLFERIPPAYSARSVVPVSPDTKTVPDFACIAHLPNNFANDPGIPLGKVKMEDLFQGENPVVHGPWHWRIRRTRRLLSRAWWVRKGRRIRERLWSL